MIKPLTSLRFLFALMVFGDHLQFFDFVRYPEFKEWHYQVIGEGFIGVSFFFILSGFILSLNYDTRLLSGKVSFRDFWVARFARIYPLHLLTLLLAVLLVVVSTDTLDDFFATPVLSVGTFLSNAALIHSFIPDQAYYFSYNGPSWSISDEMFFYFAFPFIVSLFVRNKALLRFGMLLFLAIPALMYFSTETDLHRFLCVNPFFRIVDFILGITLHQLYKHNYLTRLYRSIGGATILEVMSLASFGVVFYFHNYVPVLYRYSCYYWVPMAMVIFSFAYQAGYLSRLLSNRRLVLLGEISFSFYLIHQLVINFMLKINGQYGLVDNTYILTAIMFVVSLGLSYLLYRFVEVPSNRYIKRKYQERSAPVAVVVA